MTSAFLSKSQHLFHSDDNIIPFNSNATSIPHLLDIGQVGLPPKRHAVCAFATEALVFLLLAECDQRIDG